MKKRFWIGVILTALGALAVSCSAQAQDNDGCSLSTLHGDYAFTINGQIQPPTSAVPLPQQGIAMTHYDGNGNLSQVDLIMTNGHPASAMYPPSDVRSDGFRTNESGRYTVNADCTGTGWIKFADGKQVNLAFVIGKHGREIREVVTSITTPGGTVWAAILSDGVKLGDVDEDDDRN